MKPDYRLIHVLEYELGFRDDPPENPFSHAAFLKELYMSAPTNEPGAIIYYDPKQSRPTY